MSDNTKCLATHSARETAPPHPVVAFPCDSLVSGADAHRRCGGAASGASLVRAL